MYPVDITAGAGNWVLDGPKRDILKQSHCSVHGVVGCLTSDSSAPPPSALPHRYPTGLATKGSATRKISASFRKKPTCMPPRLLWTQHTLQPLQCRTARPTRLPHLTLVGTPPYGKRKKICPLSQPVTCCLPASLSRAWFTPARVTGSAPSSGITVSPVYKTVDAKQTHA